jgi:hypothetical protein
LKEVDRVEGGDDTERATKLVGEFGTKLGGVSDKDI